MDENQYEEYTILSQPVTEDGCIAELDRALEYLQKRPDIHKLVESEHSYKPIKGIFYVVSLNIFAGIQDKDAIFDTYNAFEIFANILDYLTSKLDELDFTKCRANYRWLPADFNPSLNERQIFMLDDLLGIINHLIPRSMKLRLYFLDLKRLEYFSRLISNQNFLVNGSKYNYQIIKSTIFDINWLSKSAENNKSDWKKLHFIQHLIDSLKVTEKIKLYLYMAVANIADDNEIENFSEIQASIDTFVGLANQTANDIRNGTVQRLNQQFPDEEDPQKIMIYDVAYVLDSNANATITITGTLLAIYRLSINPNSKLNIYNKFNFKDSLKCILTYGNDIEKLYSIQVLAQLAFDNQVLADVINDGKFCALIKELSADAGSKMEKMKKICQQLLWSIEEYKKKSTTDDTKKSTVSNELEGHIMISYNTGSRETCLRIKDELEKDNHKVWIDVNEIHGSSLDSMAKAVEQAKIILMCVTEKYRQSLNCQAEAQYSFRLNKNIIPCIMQKGYHNVDGWLGFIIADKIFIDFSKYTFEDSMRRLRNQISFITDEKKAVPAKKNLPQIPAPESVISVSHAEPDLDSKVIKIIINHPTSVKEGKCESDQRIEKIGKWNEKEVNEWFKSVHLDESFLYKSLQPCKGELLAQLYQIQQYAPEFFYKSISNNSSNLVDLKQIAIFSIALKKLFSN